MVKLGDIFSGNIPKKTMLRLVPVIVAIMIGTLFISNLVFPTVYDWRYMVISDLMSQTDNPQGYIIASLGMSIAGILMIPFLGYYQSRYGKICRGTAGVGTAFLLIGIIGLISMVTIGQILTGVNRLHEILGAVSFLGIVFSGIFYNCPILKDKKKGFKQFDMRLVNIAYVILWIPVVGMASSAGLLEIIPNDWGWVGIEWIAEGAPVILSFALWEWLLLVSIMVFLIMLVYLTPDEVKPVPR
nr:hypothetical protein [Candidatus Sigynarchaeota archaeon]